MDYSIYLIHKTLRYYLIKDLCNIIIDYHIPPKEQNNRDMLIRHAKLISRHHFMTRLSLKPQYVEMRPSQMPINWVNDNAINKITKSLTKFGKHNIINYKNKRLTVIYWS